jgi:hypothetical protein
MVLLVIASGLYRILAKTMRGYSDAQARPIFRDLVDIPADVTIRSGSVYFADESNDRIRVLTPVAPQLNRFRPSTQPRVPLRLR